MINKRTLITISFGALVTFIVFLGLEDSQNRPSLSRLPISADMAIAKIVDTYKISKSQIDKSPHYVYVKSDGNVYDSNPETNNIGKNIGHTGPTSTDGSHFAWEIIDLQLKQKYYVDAVTSDIISDSSYK